MITMEIIAIGAALVAVIAIILSIAALCKLSKLNKKYKTFMTGKDGQSLEKLLQYRLDDLDTLKSDTKENKEKIQQLFEKVEYGICKVGMVKYDAFNEMGGKLSFALVMLNEHDSGFSINSMHGVEGSYVYVKEIIHGESYIPLGDEEQKALKEALESR